jgi:ABC-type oligopeptide transport system ATPase subunit
MTDLLEARHVTKIFGGGLIRKHRTLALEDFSLSLGGGQPSITGVVGESGSGKTTMARLLLGLESPTLGEVLYRGKDLRRLSRNGARSCEMCRSSSRIPLRCTIPSTRWITSWRPP